MGDKKTGEELAGLFIDRLGTWGLEWEVLWVAFNYMIEKGVDPDIIEKGLHEGFNEWDV